MAIELLDYFCLGEIFTCIFSLILTFNILMTYSFDDRKHRLFLYGSVSSFTAAFCDIISIFCISNYDKIPLWLGITVTTLFFLLLCMIPFVLCTYANNLAFSSSKTGRTLFVVHGAFYFIYACIVLLNIKTGWIFRYDSEAGYIRGPLKNITYILTFYFVLNTIASALIKRKNMPKRVVLVFLIYPVISVLMLSIQFYNEKIIMTGAASFASLFFVYITMQSDLMEYDIITGLMTEPKLRKFTTDRNNEGYLFVFSIENMNTLMQNMDSAELNQFLFIIAKQISKYFKNLSYHISTNRFAGICYSVAELYRYSDSIEQFVRDLNKNYEDILPAPVDAYFVGVNFVKDNVSYETLTEIINEVLIKEKKDNNHTLKICNELILIEMERKRCIYKILRRELTLDSKQFQIWYQPIYSVKEKKFTYAEALARLNFTEIGNISPVEFVEVAENRGLIEKLGFVVFEKVCKFISEHKDLIQVVSVNFSVYQMINPNVVEKVLNTIKKFKLQPKNIIMEITESIFIDDFNVVQSNMEKLTQEGIRFYLDDFGTGYSNLANVVKLPFSAIKIDRSLVLMTEDKKGECFFRNILSTFKDSNLEILVEGVETDTQSKIVQNAGADYIQGFLYSRTVPEEDCIKLFQNQKMQLNSATGN